MNCYLIFLFFSGVEIIQERLGNNTNSIVSAALGLCYVSVQFFSKWGGSAPPVRVDSLQGGGVRPLEILGARLCWKQYSVD